MWSLPRRCLHGVHLIIIVRAVYAILFASALPARGASVNRVINMDCQDLCLGAACTGCIRHGGSLQQSHGALPRRCLHGVHHCALTIADER